MPFTYEYPRPALTADAVVFKTVDDSRFVLFIKRKNDPFKNFWAFPGGFVNIDETVEDGCARELYEETGLRISNLRQYRTVSTIDRDPRGRVISVIFVGIDPENQTPKSGDDATEVKWFNIEKLPQMAFDHNEILEDILKDKTLFYFK